MTLRVRRPHPNPSAVVISYHCALVSSLDGTAIASVEQTPSPASEAPSIVAQARALVGAGPSVPVVLVGFSKGCQAVRSLLLQGVAAAAYVTIDGTHDNWPLMSEARIAGWRELAARARRNEVLWIATCTQQTYTEKLKLPDHAPFASTVSVLEAATELELRTPGRHVDGGLVVESHASKEIDGPAHVHQAQVVLPKLVRELLVPRLAGVPGVSSVVDMGPAVTDWRAGFELDGDDVDGKPLGFRTVAWLGFQSQLDIREVPGPKHDPRILSFSKHCRRGGRFLGVDEHGAPRWDGGTPLPLLTDEDPWCAAAASESLRVALLPGEVPPHGLRVSVAELVADARAAGTLRPADWNPTAGSLAICGRAGESPLAGGKGHVRCHLQTEGELYQGIGGNEDNRIQWSRHARRDVLAWIDRTRALDAPGELPCVTTPATPAEVAAALRLAWPSVVGGVAKRESILVLLAQWAHETASGDSMKCWNLGNARATPGGDRHCWTFFSTYEYLELPRARAYRDGAKERTDGVVGMDVELVGTVRQDGKVRVNFHPSHIGACFKAFRTLEEGAAYYLAELRRRFAGAWHAVVAGDVADFARQLKALRYYTDTEAAYAAALQRHVATVARGIT